MAKIEAGRITLTPKNFHLPTCINSIIAVVRMKAQDKSILCNYQADADLPKSVYFDERRLRQVLLNLLGNAVKFTDKGSVTLKVSTTGPIIENRDQKSQGLRFEVHDTGVGMQTNQLENIFTPFEQVGDSQKHGEGTGLGLAISQNFVQAMGGNIQVKSEPGKGSCFWFELIIHLTDDDKNQDISDSPLNIVAYKGERKSVLVADDYESNRAVLKGLLGPLGFQVFEAVNGQDAVDKTKSLHPDIIFMYIKMPVLNGLQATNAIREITELKDVTIAAVTASVYESDINELLEAGCDAFH